MIKGNYFLLQTSWKINVMVHTGLFKKFWACSPKFPKNLDSSYSLFEMLGFNVSGFRLETLLKIFLLKKLTTKHHFFNYLPENKTELEKNPVIYF